MGWPRTITQKEPNWDLIALFSTGKFIVFTHENFDQDFDEKTNWDFYKSIQKHCVTEIDTILTFTTKRFLRGLNSQSLIKCLVSIATLFLNISEPVSMHCLHNVLICNKLWCIGVFFYNDNNWHLWNFEEFLNLQARSWGHKSFHSLVLKQQQHDRRQKLTMPIQGHADWECILLYNITKEWRTHQSRPKKWNSWNSLRLCGQFVSISPEVGAHSQD